MNEQAITAFVDAACAVQGVTLEADERERVIGQFARIAAIAAPLVELPLAEDVEMAPVYRP